MDSCTPVLIGAGGPRPGLWTVSAEGGDALPVAELPAGHSVYAVDVDPEAGLVAAGTREGRIDLLSWSDTFEPSQVQSLVQGAPVLSVCALEESRLASSDTAGRCLLWQPMEDPNHPVPLEVDGGVICSLLSLGEGTLIGLSSQGKLLLWDVTEGRTMRTLVGPIPPKKHSQVRLSYWPAHDAIVYPTRAGQLAVCQLDGSEVQTCEAHAGDFYVTIVDGDCLHTVGRQDGICKSWRDLAGSAHEESRAPMGVVSGELLTTRPGRVVLVNEEGQAAVHELGPDHLRVIHHLAGDHYRVVAGPPSQVREALALRERQTRAEELKSTILASIRSGRGEDLDPLYGEMVALGFEAMSWGLRARQACHEEDLVGELNARHEIAALFPSADGDSAPLMQPYASILEKTWQIEESQHVYESIAAIGVDAAAPEWLKNAAAILGGEDWVIEPDVPLPVVVQSATVVDRWFLGRWALDAARSVTLPEGNIDAARLVDKYRLVRSEDGRGGLPDATAQVLWWIARGSCHQVEAVVFDACDDDRGTGARLLIRVVADGLPVVLTPTIVLAVDAPGDGTSAADHNEQVERTYERISREGLITPWLREVQSVMTVALRRLRTEAMSPWPS